MGRMWFRLYTNGLHKYHSITTLWTDHVWSYTGRKSRGMADAKPYTAPIIAVNEIDFLGLEVCVGLCWRVADQLKIIKSCLIDDVSPETPSVKLSFPLLSNRESASIFSFGKLYLRLLIIYSWVIFGRCAGVSQISNKLTLHTSGAPFWDLFSNVYC